MAFTNKESKTLRIDSEEGYLDELVKYLVNDCGLLEDALSYKPVGKAVNIYFHGTLVGWYENFSCNVFDNVSEG